MELTENVVICPKCSHTIFFNAMVLGVYGEPKVKRKRKPRHKPSFLRKVLKFFRKKKKSK